MKKYSVSAETSKRIFKNWMIKANTKNKAILLFAGKVNRNANELKNINAKPC